LIDARAAQIDGYIVQVVTDDTNRDGPVDRKLHLRITHHVSRSSVELACHHWILARSNWTLKFVSLDVGVQPDKGRGEAMAQVIADTTRVAEKMLTNNYSKNLVSSIHLNEEGMPTFFTQNIYQSLVSQMRESNARAATAYDRNLRKMLQTAFDESEVIQRIAKRLEEHGFALTRAKPQELISVRPDLIGLTWQKISTEKAAGLKSGSATVIFYDLSSKGKARTSHANPYGQKPYPHARYFIMGIDFTTQPRAAG